MPLEAPPKVKWKPKRSTLPDALICSQAEAIELLRRQVFDDAIAAGWLKPCAEKPNTSDVPTKIYSVADVQLVAKRILTGEYPSKKGAGK